MPELKEKIKYIMGNNYGYDFTLSENNHLSLVTEKESLSIYDVRERETHFQFSYGYKKRDRSGRWEAPSTGIISSSYNNMIETLGNWAKYLDNRTRLSRECIRVDAIDNKMPNKERTLEGIARTYLDIETLRNRNSDELDFHEVSVWGLRKALDEAYKAGQKSGKV